MKCTTHFGLHSQTIRLVDLPLYGRTGRTQTGMSPSLLSLSRELKSSQLSKDKPLNHNSDTQRMPDFKFELFPLHSPLLGESLLVSFPPLTDMLKFSGYPYLI
jgi:hypothetical protein